MSLLQWNKFWRRNNVPARARVRSRKFACEPLESRRMLTLLGVAPAPALFTYDSTGHIQYTASTDTFDLTATPLTFKNVTGPPQAVVAPRGLAIHVLVDNSGNLIGGTAGNDLEIDGTVDPDGIPADTVSGVLLTGEVTAFGYLESGVTDQFDFRFTPTGGQLLSYFAGSDIGMTISSENSTFANSFSQDFQGGAKGNIGSIPPRPTPTFSTTASETAGGVVGSALLSDAATLAGGNISGGSITFSLTAPDGSTSTVGTVPVTGAGTYNAPTVSATEVGTYTWHATYSGDANDGPAIDDGTNESVMTVKADSAISTSASESAGGVVGTSVLSDSATITGGYNVSGGTITFTLTAPDGSTSTVGTVPVTGAGTYNAPTVSATEVGTYTWHASYSGDGLNNGAIDDGTNESVMTVKAGSAISTSASESAGGVVGTAVLGDSATITGGYNVSGGTITFTLTAPNGSTSTVGTVPVTGVGTYNAPTVSATEVGTYTWHASYSGDGLNNGAIDDGTNESVMTVKAGSAIGASASESAGGVVGTAVLSDSATITGGYNVSGGTITFTLTAPDGSTSTVGTVPVTGAGTYNAPTVSATEVGTYTWHASYSGDGLNNGAIDDGTNESVMTVKAGSAISTSASESAGGVVGTSVLGDSATITGGYNVSGGAITFTLTAPNGSTSTVGTVPVTGAGTYNAPTVTATQFGTYTWHASYSGDGLNNGAIDNGTNESVKTVKSSPAISTQASETAGGVCNTSMLSDSATITGGYNVSGGTITFTLTAPNGSTTTVGTVAVTGAGTYNSPAVKATQVGTYTWHANYSGDGLNNGAIDNGAHESLVVVSATGTISGTKFLDVTGNGLTSDDTPMSGIKIYLDTNNDGSWESNEPYQITGTTGTYAFTGLSAGTYTVREVVPSGYVETAPVLSDHYTISLAAGQTSSGNNFANAIGCGCATSTLSNIVYVINGTQAVSDLRGNTSEGETVEVSFTVAAGTSPEVLTLVSYTAPGSTFVASQAAQQQIFDIDTGTFGPGSYTLTVSLPHSYYQVDFVCGHAIDQFGPANSNIFYSAQNRLLSADNAGTHAPLANGSTLSGFVYVDANADGKIQPTERVVAGDLIKLTGTDSSGHSVSQSSLTDTDGMYLFDNLLPGTYIITESQPGTYTDGADSIGSLGGTKSNDKFTGIVVGTNVDGVGYNFGEQQVTTGAVTSQQTANVAFWASSSGQALIKALNGGSNSKSLSAWLASNFNNMYGADAGANDLTGKTNTQVASFYQSLASSTSKKLDAETMALALNVYVTTSSLAGTTAVSYGFAVSTNGVGAATVNVGTNGAAFGVDDNSVLTCMDLMYLTNQRANDGILWDGDGSDSLSTAENILRNEAYSVFDAVNNT